MVIIFESTGIGLALLYYELCPRMDFPIVLLKTKDLAFFRQQ
jgi:hypothetical protein